MKVRALRNKGAGKSPCGSTVAGEVYGVPDELLPDDAKLFLTKGWAELVADAAPAALAAPEAPPAAELELVADAGLNTETGAALVKGKKAKA